MSNEQSKKGGFVGGIEVQLQRAASNPSAQGGCCGSDSTSGGCCGEVTTVAVGESGAAANGACCEPALSGVGAQAGTKSCC